MDKITKFIIKNKIKLLAYSYWLFLLFLFWFIIFIWIFNLYEMRLFLQDNIYYTKIILSFLFMLSLFFSWKYFLEITKNKNLINKFLSKWNINQDWILYILNNNSNYNEDFFNKYPETDNIDFFIKNISSYLYEKNVTNSFNIPGGFIEKNIIYYDNSNIFSFIKKKVLKNKKDFEFPLTINNEYLWWDIQILLCEQRWTNAKNLVQANQPAHRHFLVHLQFSLQTLFLSILAIKTLNKNEILYLSAHLLFMLLIQFTAVWELNTLLNYFNF